MVLRSFATRKQHHKSIPDETDEPAYRHHFRLHAGGTQQNQLDTHTHTTKKQNTTMCAHLKTVVSHNKAPWYRYLTGPVFCPMPCKSTKRRICLEPTAAPPIQSLPDGSLAFACCMEESGPTFFHKDKQSFWHVSFWVIVWNDLNASPSGIALLDGCFSTI